MDNTDVRARHRCQFAEHEPLHVGISCPVCHRTVVEVVGKEEIKADIAVESHLARSCHRQQEETGESKPSLVIDEEPEVKKEAEIEHEAVDSMTGFRSSMFRWAGKRQEHRYEHLRCIGPWTEIKPVSKSLFCFH